MPASKVSADDMNAFYRAAFKGDRGMLPRFDHIEDGKLTMSQTVDISNMRPSGNGQSNFISGPTQMQLADHAAYSVIFTRIGLKPMALTTNLNIDFLRPCMGTEAIAEAKIIQMGKTRALIEVNIRGNDNEKISSRSTVSFALPRG